MGDGFRAGRCDGSGLTGDRGRPGAAGEQGVQDGEDVLAVFAGLSRRPRYPVRFFVVAGRAGGPVVRVRDMSEAAEEGEELIVWPVAVGRCARRREPGEGVTMTASWRNWNAS